MLEWDWRRVCARCAAAVCYVGALTLLASSSLLHGSPSHQDSTCRPRSRCSQLGSHYVARSARRPTCESQRRRQAAWCVWSCAPVPELKQRAPSRRKSEQRSAVVVHSRTSLQNLPNLCPFVGCCLFLFSWLRSRQTRTYLGGDTHTIERATTTRLCLHS